MTEIYEIQGWTNKSGWISIHKDFLYEHTKNEEIEKLMTEEEIEESIPTAINRSVTKVSYRPHEGHESVFYFIVDENGLKIELEKIEGNHKITGYRDFCFNSMEKETMALGKEVEVTHYEH
jgi:hypothetical protein